MTSVKEGTAWHAVVSGPADQPGSAESQYRRLNAQKCSALTSERAPRLSKTKLAVVGIAVGLLIGLLSWPIKYVCPNGPCTSAPDADGYVHRYYEIQPFGASVIESIVDDRWPLRYSAGVEKDRDHS